MRKRKGQALIIVVIIIAIVMAVFANSLTTAIRYHAEEETEIYQREQALYLAEMGINQMIFNINKNGDHSTIPPVTVPGIGSYKTIYHAPDNSGFGGSAYIESIGTVGKGKNKVTRRIFASVENTSDAFKYCLFTGTGGRDGVYDDTYFTNSTYGDAYKYNTNASLTPRPDHNYHKYAEKVKNKSRNNTYKIKSGDLGHVIYIRKPKPSLGDTLTIDFGILTTLNKNSFSLSIITNAENVTIINLLPNGGEWSGARSSKDGEIYPVITHIPPDDKGTLTIDYSTAAWFSTLTLEGFVYTGGHIDMEYNFFGWLSSGEFHGEVIEGNPGERLGGGWPGIGTTMIYTRDYYNYPPPHFIIPLSERETKVLPGTFREEY